MVAEMDKLKTMARKTEDRQQMSELMALVAEKTTVAVAVKPDRTDSKVGSHRVCQEWCINGYTSQMTCSVWMALVVEESTWPLEYSLTGLSQS